MMDNAEAIVIAAPTLMDGRVVRWYKTMAAAAAADAALSASRSRVSFHHEEIPWSWIQDARAIHFALNADPNYDPSGFITHVKPLFGAIRRATPGEAW